MYHLMTLKSIKTELYAETFRMRRFIMVRKSESINRKPLGEEVITFTDRKGREKEVTVLNSVIFTDKEKRELEDKIVLIQDSRIAYQKTIDLFYEKIK